MARKRFEDTTRGQIFFLMKDYAERQRTLPNRRALYEKVIKPQLAISLSRFRECFNTLIAEGRVEVDPETGAVAIVKSKLEVEEEADVFPESKGERVHGRIIGSRVRPELPDMEGI